MIVCLPKTTQHWSLGLVLSVCEGRWVCVKVCVCDLWLFSRSRYGVTTTGLNTRVHGRLIGNKTLVVVCRSIESIALEVLIVFEYNTYYFHVSMYLNLGNASSSYHFFKLCLVLSLWYLPDFNFNSMFFKQFELLSLTCFFSSYIWAFFIALVFFASLSHSLFLPLSLSMFCITFFFLFISLLFSTYYNIFSLYLSSHFNLSLCVSLFLLSFTIFYKFKSLSLSLSFISFFFLCLRSFLSLLPHVSLTFYFPPPVSPFHLYLPPISCVCLPLASFFSLHLLLFPFFTSSLFLFIFFFSCSFLFYSSPFFTKPLNFFCLLTLLHLTLSFNWISLVSLTSNFFFTLLRSRQTISWTVEVLFSLSLSLAI